MARQPLNIRNLTESDKKALYEVYQLFETRQWFDKAEVFVHPNQMKKTLELTCNYDPLLERKEILSFTQRHDLALEIVDLSHNDRATK
jgi:hypothetical protein